MKKRRMILLLVLSCSFVAIHAQEFSLAFKRNQGGFNYKVAGGNRQLKYGGGIGINYTHFLNKHWALVTGLAYTRFSSNVNINGALTASGNKVDDMGSAFVYTTTAKEYREAQSVSALSIPLLLQLKERLDDKVEWYANGGATVLFPSRLHYTSRVAALSVSGYYPDVNLTVRNLPQHGFGTTSNWSYDGEADALRTGFLASLETGIRIQLPAHFFLYGGVYIDYGLNNMAKASTVTHPFTYSSQGINGMSANTITSQPNYVSNAKPIMFGPTLKIAWNK